MFEYKRDQYIRVITMLCHIVVTGSFLLSFHYSVLDLDIFATNMESGQIHLGELLRLEAVLVGMLIANKIFINLFYANRHQFYLPTPKNQIEDFFIIALCVVIVGYILRCLLVVEILSRIFFITQYTMAVLLNIIATYGVYYFFKMINSFPENKRTFIMIGSNRRAVEFAHFFELNSILGFYNLGYLDDNNYSGEDIKILGKLKNFSEVVRNNVVDIVIVSLPIRSCYDDIMNIIATSEIHGISVHYFANIFEPKHSHIASSKIGALASIIMHTAPLEDWQMLVKRFFDIIFSIVVILATTPIMLAVAIAIKFWDHGEILFTQQRVGYNKRIFKVYKFRTMCKDADKMQDQMSQFNEMDGPVFKIKNDPRLIPFGHFLRKYSLDELPQLFNVLKGDMSIVGPRPMALRDYEGFSEDWQRRRFSMRPGLTCYWQVRGRNALSFETWMRLDMEYIDNWNLFEDLKIILLTIPEVLRGGGM